MTDKPDFPADVPATPPTPGKTQPIPPEMPPAQVPTPEIMPTPTPHPGGPPGHSCRPSLGVYSSIVIFLAAEAVKPAVEIEASHQHGQHQ